MMSRASPDVSRLVDTRLSLSFSVIYWFVYGDREKEIPSRCSLKPPPVLKYVFSLPSEIVEFQQSLKKKKNVVYKIDCPCIWVPELI